MKGFFEDTVKVGLREDMVHSITWLCGNQKRLILLHDADQYSSYSEYEYKAFSSGDTANHFQTFLDKGGVKLQNNQSIV